MKLLKNPIFWGAIVLFGGGMGVGILGWSRYESTSAQVAKGSEAIIILGCAMILAGAIIMFTQGNRKS